MSKKITHAELVKRGAAWLSNNKNHCYRSPVVLTEFRSYAKEIPDVIGMNHQLTTVIECKTSLEDFKGDLRKPHRGDPNSLGNFRFYLCPHGLIPVKLIPEDWGLLYCHPDRITIRKKPNSHYEPQVRAEEYHLLYSIARRVVVKGLMKDVLRSF